MDLLLDPNLPAAAAGSKPGLYQLAVACGQPNRGDPVRASRAQEQDRGIQSRLPSQNLSSMLMPTATVAALTVETMATFTTGCSSMRPAQELALSSKTTPTTTTTTTIQRPTL